MNLLPPALKHRLERREAERILERVRAAKTRQGKKDAHYFWPLIRDTLVRLGYRHELPERKKPGLLAMLITGKRGFQVVRTDEIRIGPANDYIAFHVDPMKLPWNTSVMSLVNDATIADELSVSCGRKVIIELDTIEHTGVWITVNTDDSIAGIPRVFHFKEAFHTIPKKAHPLAFAIGLGEGRTVYHNDLNRVMSLMIAGSIGSGKSVMLNQLLLTLGLRNSPKRLHLWLCDFKGGIELTFYKKLPHVKQFLKDVDEVAPKIAELHDELKQRQALFLDEDVNIDEYNRRQVKPEDRLPYIVMIVDEFAELALGLDRTNKAITMKLLMRLFQKGRAAGIYFVLATQSPTKEIMDKLIKHNIPSRMAFNCSTMHQSVSVVGDSSATGLSPRGRAIWANDGVNTLVQAPLIKKGQKLKLVKIIVDKWSKQAEEMRVDYDEILRYGLTTLNGDLTGPKLFEQFRRKMPRSQLRAWLQEIENTVVTIEGKEYFIMPGTSQKPRRLIPAQSAASEQNERDAFLELVRQSASRRPQAALLKGNGEIQHG